ncbi:hypothetical protein Rsub_11147 [Raphidocelis subcapitata]|uniref:DUF7912 domain-containing protein n=1 Tax=Raphidocelis subcapitata TaxID=307507 RepID=A0A2V0PDW8_9CHLO|nr:hypothetical protein Rsub_11147 [Raphidocelis subcapitata]|eukprot:GBF98036.1 hypothetical protein Rsub_11147 [Raphidocelis subcapitata]
MNSVAALHTQRWSGAAGLPRQRPAVPLAVQRHAAVLQPPPPPPPLRPCPARRPVACAAKRGGGGSGGKQQQAQQQQQQAQQQGQGEDEDGGEGEEADGVIYLDGDEDDEGEGALLGGEAWGDDEFETDDDDDDGGGWLEDDDDAFGGGAAGSGDDDALPPGFVSTSGAPWGAAALAAAEAVLAGPGMAELRLYALRAFAAPARVDVRLDKLTDAYGSPALEDIEAFSRRFAAALEAELGAEEAGAIALEVSTPGAERSLALPADLARFGGLPLRVEFDAARGAVAGGEKKSKKGGGGGGAGAGGGEHAGADQQQQQQKVGSGASASGGSFASGVAILELVALDEGAGSSEWRLADVRANAPTKGRGLSKRQREQRLTLPLDALVSARVHVDF